MPFNGSGGFNPLSAPVFPAVANTTIVSSYYNANLNDIFTGFGNCVTRDGQSPATANLPMGGFKHTGAGNATGTGQYLTYGQNGNFVDLTLTGALTGTTATFSGGVTFNGAVTANSTVTLAAGAAINGAITGVTTFTGSGLLTARSGMFTGNVVPASAQGALQLGAVVSAAITSTDDAFIFWATSTQPWVSPSGSGNGSLVLASRNTASASIIFATQGSARAVLDASGNFGIGSAAPSARFSVLDTNGIPMRFGDIAAAPNTQLAVYVGAATSALTGATNGDLVLIPRTSTTSSITFWSGNGAAVERARLDASGNWLLGRTSSSSLGLFQIAESAAGSIADLASSFTGSALVRVRGVANQLAGIRVQNATSGTGATNGGGFSLLSDNTSVELNAYGGLLSFAANNTERLRISSAGIILEMPTNKELGYKGLPAASVTTGAFTGNDRGKCVYATAGITVPNSTMSAEDVVTIVNTTAAPITITASITTLTQAGTTNTGNRTLAANGIATVIFKSGTSALISGNVT